MNRLVAFRYIHQYRSFFIVFKLVESRLSLTYYCEYLYIVRYSATARRPTSSAFVISKLDKLLVNFNNDAPSLLRMPPLSSP